MKIKGKDNTINAVPEMYHGIRLPNLFEFVLSDNTPTRGVAIPSAIL